MYECIRVHTYSEQKVIIDDKKRWYINEIRLDINIVRYNAKKKVR